MVRRWRLIGYFPILYNPLNPQVHMSLGHALRRLGQTDKAAQAYSSAVRSQVRFCRDWFCPTADLGYRGVRGAVLGLGYRFTV
jgi:hypothetical protein